MKQLLFLFLIVFHFSITAMGQLPKFTYCEIHTFTTGTKVSIELINGDTQKLLYDLRFDDPSVNPNVFNYIIKSINLMAKEGWELVQVYTSSSNDIGRLQYHYILRKQIP